MHGQPSTTSTGMPTISANPADVLATIERYAEGDASAHHELEQQGYGPYCPTHDLFSCPFAGNPHLPCL